MNAGFVMVGAVLLYAFGAGLVSELLRRLLWKVWRPAPYFWIDVFRNLALVYVFWWLLTYGPIQLGQ